MGDSVVMSTLNVMLDDVFKIMQRVGEKRGRVWVRSQKKTVIPKCVLPPRTAHPTKKGPGQEEVDFRAN